jgi:hypothetical protein
MCRPIAKRKGQSRKSFLALFFKKEQEKSKASF